MSCAKNEDIDISNELELSPKDFPMVIGNYEGVPPLRSPTDPIKVGDEISVNIKSSNVKIKVKVQSICTKSIQGQIVNVQGDEHQDLCVNARVAVLNNRIMSVHVDD